LSNACAVSGGEGEVRDIVIEHVEPYADDLEVDVLGNVLVTCKSRKRRSLRVMLAAHMDEVGFMLVADKRDGIFRFEVVGGIDVRQLVGKSVWVGKDHVPGVIGSRPVHLDNGRQQIIPMRKLRIDLGPGGSKMAKPGDRATFATSFKQVGPSLFGKALDDRLGVAALIELVKHAPKNVELLAAFTVQEEVGVRGARVAAYVLNPDMGIAVDSTPAYDLPAWDDEENTRYNSRMGEGPALYVADRGTISDPRLLRHFSEVGDALGIPYQYRQPGGGRTDAAAIHRQREGIPSISISVPGRSPHTAVGIARLSDWQNTLSLLYEAISRMSLKILERS